MLDSNTQDCRMMRLLRDKWQLTVEQPKEACVNAAQAGRYSAINVGQTHVYSRLCSSLLYSAFYPTPIQSHSVQSIGML